MFFNWATSKLTSLSETLAPPPSTPSHRFLSALSQNNEPLALSILHDPNEPFDVYTVLNNRGMSSIHVAASFGSLNVAKEIMRRGVRVDLTDYNGWTALHHAAAASMNSLPLVKYLVDECSASILLKTNQGGTAYDVASSQSVRGYLLPRQLQLETKECLDNGGKGLMPGIDLGGCQVNYSNLAPPPMIGSPAPTMGAVQNNNYDPSAALMQPPPVRGIGASPRQPVQPPQHGMMSPRPLASNLGAASDYATDSVNNAVETMHQPQQQWQPTIASPAPVQQVIHDQQQLSPPPVTPATNESTIPPSSQPPTQTTQPEQTPQPTSQSEATPQPKRETPRSNNTPSSYALRGGNANTASILTESSGRKIYKPDGFHSSSNDKELQAKYGHVANEFEVCRKAAVPPPPVSGGAPSSTAGGAPPNSSWYNPYSAARPSSGYIGGSGRARYPAYCAVSDSVSAPPSLSGGGYNQYSAPVASYANFSQGVDQQQQQQQQQWNDAQLNFQQQQWNGGQQNVQQHQWTDQQHQANSYNAVYNQQPVQQELLNGQGEIQQNQAHSYEQQNLAPVHVEGTQPAYSSSTANVNHAPASNQNDVNPPPNAHVVSAENHASDTTPTPPKPSQPIMAADAAAKMFEAQQEGTSSLSGGGYNQYSAPVASYANFSQGIDQQQQQWNDAQLNFQQQQWNGGQQNVQQHQWIDQQHQANSYNAIYNQQPVQQELLNGQGEIQQNQAYSYEQQNLAPVHVEGTQPAYSSSTANVNHAPASNQNDVNPPPNGHVVSAENNASDTTPTPPKPSQPIMAADAAAKMFETPQADTPKRPVTVEGGSLPSFPMGNANAEESFAAPTVDTPAKSEDAANVFTSSPASTKPATDHNAYVTVGANDTGSFYSSAAHESTPSVDVNNGNLVADTMSDDAGSIFGSLSQPIQPIGTAVPSVASGEKQGGLPPPPVIGGTKPLNTSSTFVASSVDSSLPPPPMTKSSSADMKEDDITDHLADVSLS